MNWRLTLRRAPPGALDAAPLQPAALAALDERALAALPLNVANATVALGEWFDVQRHDGDALELAGETARLDRIGAHLRAGRIVVRGPSGRETGYAMRGGEVEVQGDTGDGLACGMRGGALEVRGSAGDGVGGAACGERQGMRGGRVLVHGDVGAECGARLRRGVILVGGRTGPLCAARLIAGTIVVCGALGDDAGVAMKRGTLIAGTASISLPAGFEATGEWPMPWLGLLARAWRGLPAPWGTLAASPGTLARAIGDRRVNGRGELIVWPALAARD
jgi:formylmethanofuran dehydrogenase subunit C